MKTQTILFMKTAVLLIGLMALGAFGQTQPKTVTDFYLALPESVHDIKGMDDPNESGFRDGFYFSAGGQSRTKAETVKYRRSLMKTEDLKNGYLRLESSWEGWVEIALFKKADETYLVAVSQVGCGPGCDGEIMFLNYRGGVWTNVTKQVFPVSPASGSGYFKLPRFGTTIELHRGEDCGADSECEAREKQAVFKWNREKFVK